VGGNSEDRNSLEGGVWKADFLSTFREKGEVSSEYRLLGYTKAYIGQKSSAYAGREADRRLGRALGYNPDKPRFMTKFTEHRRQWDTLARPVPLEYLQLIGVSWDELQVCYEADCHRFAEEQAKPRWLSHYVVRVMPTVYVEVYLPEKLREAEAIERIAHGEYSHRVRLINYPELLLIHFAADAAEPTHHYREPRISRDRGFLYATDDGAQAGVTRVK
jgi:hypothetical protein